MAFSVKAEHQQEILKFMRYFNLKKEEFLKERQRDMKEFLSDALNEGDTIFNKEDVNFYRNNDLNVSSINKVESLFQKYQAESLKYSDKELSLIVHLTSSYLQSLLFEAEQQNAELHVDINSIENNKVIEQLQMLEKQGSNINDLTKSALSKKVSRLPSIGAGYNNDPALLVKINELEKELENYKKKNQSLQNEVIGFVKEKKTFNEPNFDDFSIKTETTYKNELDELNKKLTGAHKEIEGFRQKIQVLTEEQNKKLSESTQVNNLKKMLNTKNEQIKAFKTRLAKYEKIEETD